MASWRVGLFKRLWMQWKSLELPWRKRRLVGIDLAGTTYWELRMPGTASGLGSGSGSAPRIRRIAQHPRSTHYADVQTPPAWLQWLRYTRSTAPTLEEQTVEVARQVRLRQLAAEANDRWQAKDRLVGSTTSSNSLGGAQEGTTVQGQNGKPQESDDLSRTRKDTNTMTKKSKNTATPWDRPRQANPSDNWEPEAWTPTGGARR